MHSKSIAGFLVLISISCTNADSTKSGEQGTHNNHYKIDKVRNDNPYPEIVSIPAPIGFKRMDSEKASFAIWLEHVHLKKNKTVYLFNGQEKRNQLAQFAVLDIPLGDKDLQQCADAVMRLRASYLFDERKFDEIAFYDNEKKGYRFTEPYSARHFEEYIQKVFAMCGTASLSKQLRKIKFEDIQPGDVLIRGGSPGHAVIVMDVVMDTNGHKQYMLAQSYMPAQDIHLLLNPVKNDSPWYDVSDEKIVETPEYTFRRDELMRW